MPFERVRSMKGGRGTIFGSIDKSGRMIVPHVIASTCDARPGMFFELLVDRDASQILLKPQACETAYSVRASSTGRTSDWGARGSGGRVPSLVVSVQTALSSVGMRVVNRLRVPISWSPEHNGLVVQLPSPEIISSDVVVGGEE